MNFKANETSQKLRGGYYTPPDIARFLLRWISVISPTSLLEPGCGDGAFLRAIANERMASLQHVSGFEIDPIEANKARGVGPALGNAKLQVFAEDFIGWTLARVMRPTTFDAAVGNPPFIRYQYLDPSIQGSAERLFAVHGLPFTRHTNAWVSFVVGAFSMVRPGGRLAMVVPAELLHVLHAQGLRGYLLRQASRILVLDPEELWFDGTLQGAVLLLVDKKANESDRTLGVAVRTIRSRSELELHPEDIWCEADFVNDESVSAKWMQALLSHSQREVLRAVRQLPAVRSFVDIADVDVGIVTGANKFFLVPNETVETFALSEWAHPMFGRSEHVPGVIYDAAVHRRNQRLGMPTNFLWFQDTKLTTSAKAYIRAGEAEGLHTRYKCRIRKPWYVVPSVYSTPIGMLKRSHNFPRLVLNRLNALTTDTAYRITVAAGIAPADLVYSFVNSLTALTAELEGRHYGGGVLEMVPSEIEKVLIPLTRSSSVGLQALDKMVSEGVDAEVVLTTQDSEVLHRAGLSKDQAIVIHQAWSELRSRRHRTPSGGEPDQEITSVKGSPVLVGE